MTGLRWQCDRGQGLIAQIYAAITLGWLRQEGQTHAEAFHPGHGGTGSQRWAGRWSEPRPQSEGGPAAPGDVVNLSSEPVRGKVRPPDTVSSGGKSDRRVADHMTEVDMSLNLVGMGSDASDTNLHK